MIESFFKKFIWYENKQKGNHIPSNGVIFYLFLNKIHDQEKGSEESGKFLPSVPLSTTESKLVSFFHIKLGDTNFKPMVSGFSAPSSVPSR